MFIKVLLLTVLVLLAFSSNAVYASDLTEGAVVEQRPLRNATIDGEIIVWFNTDVTEEQIMEIISESNSIILEQSSVTPKRLILQVPKGDEQEYVDMYNSLPEVRIAGLNQVAQGTWTPNDTYYDLQWHFNKPDFIRLEEAWDIENGGNSSVVIAILDSGVSYENRIVPSYESSEVNGNFYVLASDLEETIFVNPIDFINNDLHPNDQHGHGTHVCGTIAQNTNNSRGVAGMAFNCSIMPVQVLDFQNYGTTATVTDGIDWARENDANIINMSLGFQMEEPIVEAAVIDAYDSDIILVASVGNDYSNFILYPAAYTQVIAVGSVQWDGTRAPYSNYDYGLEIVAPGGNLLLDQNDDGYGDGVLQQTFTIMNDGTNLASVSSLTYKFLQGTSMACPHVSGLVGLIMSRGVTGGSNIRGILHDSAIDLGAPGYDIYYGYGLINCEETLIATNIASEHEMLLSSAWDIAPTQNPSFDGALSIRLVAPIAGYAEVNIYDVSGRRVGEYSREFESGEHSILFDDLSGGVYFCQLNTEDFILSKSIVVLD